MKAYKIAEIVSAEQLQTVMEQSLASDGHSDDYINGFIAAQKFAGWLRPQCPNWIRRSALIIYSASISKVSLAPKKD